MRDFRPGLVHTPVTPFNRDHEIDFSLFERIIEFHLRNGADSLALPMHVGESVSLSDSEKRTLLEFAIRQVVGRVPVIAHVSDAGTSIAAALAQHAEQIGAAAIIATTPYYWTPPPPMVLEHFAQIGAATRLPLFVLNAPDDMAGGRISADLAIKLIARTETFSGVVDSSLDWQFMIELMTDAPRARPDFQLLAGDEYMVSAAAIGATGMFSALAGIAPKLVRELFDLCREEQLFEARPAQEATAALRQLLKAFGVGGVKSAMAAVGRDSGEPRTPNRLLNASSREALGHELRAIPALAAEPNGW